MDTVEELNGTYFCACRSNLTASELLFMIFCENTANQFGIQDFGAVAAIVSGRSTLSTRGKPIGATKGTSYASKAARSVFKKTKIPFGISLPTWLGGYTPLTAKRVMVRNLAPFVGRSIPLLGIIIIAADVSEITYHTIRDYNMIARGADKLW
ncbi:STM2901 family protein [Yersinia enterocolitica]|uniref:STM2901 family protein n=1 Tax=Yersinia enterocolitica TaxID=630 RepID=UPI003CFDD98C